MTFKNPFKFTIGTKYGTAACAAYKDGVVFISVDGGPNQCMLGTRWAKEFTETDAKSDLFHLWIKFEILIKQENYAELQKLEDENPGLRW